MSNLKGDSTQQFSPGVLGENTIGDGVRGYSIDGVGVWAESQNARGVVGVSNSSDGNGTGVWGECDNGRAVVGRSLKGGVGVWGHSETARGVVGVSNSSDGNGTGVWGECDNGRAVVGRSLKGGVGVWGHSETARGVVGVSNGQNGVAIWGENPNGTAIVGKGPTAGFFEGDVKVSGSLIVQGVNLIELINQLKAQINSLQDRNNNPPSSLTPIISLEFTPTQMQNSFAVKVGGSGFKPSEYVILFSRNTTTKENWKVVESVIADNLGRISMSDNLTLFCNPQNPSTYEFKAKGEKSGDSIIVGHSC